MTFEIGLLLALVMIALVLFATEAIEADVTGLGLLVALIITGLLPADKAFAGFGSDSVIMILGLLILTAALMRTGVMDLVGRFIVQRAGNEPRRLQTALMTSASGLSAFISNTAATAFFVPIAFGIAKRVKISPSKLLMPLAFAAILAGCITLVGTSTNLVVSGMMTAHHLPPIGMFELAPVGLPITIVGLIYMMTLGRRMIPDRYSGAEINATDAAADRAYMTELLILPKSRLIGKTLAESGLGRDLDLTVLRIDGDDRSVLQPRAETRIREGDTILVQGRSEDILKIKDKAGIDIKADVKLAQPDLEDKDTAMVEMIILPNSPLIGRTLREQRFREHYGLQVLGVNRHGEQLSRKLSVLPLHMGDVLMVQGPKGKIQEITSDRTIRVLSDVGAMRPKTRQAPLAIGIFVLVLTLATVEVLSLPVAMMLGAALVFVTRCITPEEAYSDIEWKAIILVGSMLGLGTAIEDTGAARYLSSLIVEGAGLSHPVLLLAAFFLLTVFLTQPMSNQAAAIVVLPIALQTAHHLSLNPRPFAMMIAFAASCSFITPLEPACILVYGAGRYRFADFMKVGSLLTLLIFAVTIILVPLVWPLQPM